MCCAEAGRAKQSRIDGLSILEEESKSTVNQLTVQFQELQDKVNTLSDCNHSYPRGCKRMQRDVAPSRYWQGEALDDQAAMGPGSGGGLRHGGLESTRAENSADILTHPTTGEEMAAGLDLMGVRRELAVGPASGRKSPH